MPKVSIVLPSYNYANYLDERIQSLLGQTYQDFELIVVDDASTDNSVEVIQKYASDNRVKTRFFSENSGLPYKRWNDGAAMATGDYILFAGADDSCAPTMLEKLVDKLDKYPDVAIAYCQSMEMDAQGNLVRSMKRYTDTLDKKRWNQDFVDRGINEYKYLCIKITIPNASAALIKLDIFRKAGGFDESLKLVADWMLWSRILLTSDVAFVSEPLNYFRCHKKTVRRNMSRLGTHIEEMYGVVSTILESSKLPSDCYERAYSRLAYRWLNSTLKLMLSQPKMAVQHARHCYLIASEVDPKINQRLLLRLFRDLSTLGLFTIRERLMWR